MRESWFPDATRAACGDAHEFIGHGSQTVKGRSQPVELFEPKTRRSHDAQDPVPCPAVSGGAALAEPGSVSRATDLKKRLDSATVAKLAANSQVDIGKRQGAWAQVRTSSGATGWIKLLNLRSGAASSGSALSGIGKIANVARRLVRQHGHDRRQGLSAEQIKNARPDPQQVEKLNRRAVQQRRGAAFRQGRNCRHGMFPRSGRPKRSPRRAGRR